MTKPLIIGICGRSCAGKDTFGAAIAVGVEACGKKASKYSFATPLKEACEVLFGGDGVDHWYTQAGKAAAFPYWAEKLGPKYGAGRNILVTMGTDVMRYRVDLDVWLYIAEWRLTHSDADVVVIPDIRFDNEAKWVLGMGGEVIEVVNTNQNPQKKAGWFVRALRKLPVAGTSCWLGRVLVKFGYANHASEDGISERFVSRRWSFDSTETNELIGRASGITAASGRSLTTTLVIEAQACGRDIVGVNEVAS